MCNDAELLRAQEMSIKRGEFLIAIQEICLQELKAELKFGVHGGGSGPVLARKIMKIFEKGKTNG